MRNVSVDVREPGANVVVKGEKGKRICVDAYRLFPASEVDGRWMSGETELSARFPVHPSTVRDSDDAEYAFACEPGEQLVLWLSDRVLVRGTVNFWLQSTELRHENDDVAG